MKRYWNAFIMCQSMFCAIPCPFRKWDEKARPLMILFLPFIGIEIGVVWAALVWLMITWQLPQLVTGAVLCLYPFFVTGFMHLDGFMDVTDAVKSWRDLERRREILKDSRVGAFAVIACGALMIMQFACTGSIAAAFGGLDVGFMAMPGALGLSMTGVGCLCLVLIPVVSRCCSGAALSFLPVMPASQYAGSEDKLQASVFLVLMAVSVCAGFALAGKFGFVILACIAGYALALVRAFTSLKGVNGDVAGYALSVGELCGLAALALMI